MSCTVRPTRAALVLVSVLAFLAPASHGAAPPASPPPGSLPPHLILVPLCRQETGYTCGVAATQALLCYHLDCGWRQDRLARKLKADPQTGTRYKAIQRFFQSQGYSAEVHTDMTLQDLEASLDAGTPVICLIQAWAGHPVEYAADWDDGHYVVAVGYDAEQVYFMDPSTLGSYTFIPVGEFVARWHDMDPVSGARLVHFGMLVAKASAHYTPGGLRHME